MFTNKKNYLLSTISMASICIIIVLFTGCPTLAPLSSTKLEIGGNPVSSVIEAWKEEWYRFEVDKDNTPLILIFKNLGGADDAWLGYQINWYYKAKGGLQLLNSIEVPPTGPANPDNIIIEDKARNFWVAPYKGKYYIRIYGYAQPVSGNKKYTLPYMIALAKPETYDDATELATGVVKEVNVVGDILSIFKLNVSPGAVFRIRVEDTLDDNIVKPINTLKNINVTIVRRNEDGNVFTLYTAQEINQIDYTLAVHTNDKNKYFLILENTYELGNTKIKITFGNILVGTLTASNTAQSISIKGKEGKAYKLQVESGKIYSVTLETIEDTSYSIIKVDANGNQSTVQTNQLSIPSGNTNEYYLVLNGKYESTSATVSVLFKSTS